MVRRWSGLLLITTLLWLGWLNWGKVVFGSTLAGRPQFRDIYDQEESTLNQLFNWNRIPYEVQQRKRRGHEQTLRESKSIAQCSNRLPAAIETACLGMPQVSQHFPSQFSGKEELQGRLYGRAVMQKRSSPRPPLQYTNAYDECCQNGPCSISQLQKYCHHFKFRNLETTTTTTEAPTRPPTTLVNVTHRLLESKLSRVSARSDDTRMPYSSQSFKPHRNRLRIKSNIRMTSTSELLRQTSKCLEDKSCKKELEEKIISAIFKNSDKLESLGGLCVKGNRKPLGQESAPDILRILLGLLKAFVSPTSSNKPIRNTTGDCYSSTDDGILPDQYQGFQNRYLSRRPCQPVPTVSEIEVGKPNTVDNATYE